MGPVLWLAGEHPGPRDTGLLTYSAGMTEALAEAGAEVTGLALLDRGGDGPDQHVRWRIVGGVRRPQVASLASRLPNIASSYRTPGYRAAVAAALEERDWHAVVIDHLQMGWAAREVGRRASPPHLVYFSADHETSARRQIADSARGLKGAVLTLDAIKCARLEAAVVRASALTTAITEADRHRFAADHPGARLLVLPPGYGGRRVTERRIGAEVPRRCAVLGNLHWHVKQANLERFLRVADPLFAAAGAEIAVIGPAPDELVARLSKWTRATTFTGRVDDVGEELARCRLGIVSEPVGGGFKLKTLDYVFHRVPMATLAGSAEGLPLVAGLSVMEHPSEEALAHGALAALDDLDTLNRVQEAAYRACDGEFSWASRGATCYEALASLG